MQPTILSHNGRAFLDREDAGIQLGRVLKSRVEKGLGKPLVLGIPRGGMITAWAISTVLDCDLDLMLTHKIRAPFNPELAIGSVSEDGRMFLNDALVRAMNVDSAYIEEEKEIQLEDMARRGGIFRSIYPKIPLEGREVIITDDGIATGATMQAAFWTAHQEKAAWIVGAFPVAHPRTLERLREDTDDLVCLKAPMFFDAVARFYASFGQVSDEDVLHILRQESERKSKGPKSCILH